MDRERIPRDRVWRHSRNICALSDGERHLGHIVLTANGWHAFDATHLNDDRNGYRDLGVYGSVKVAKAVVEGSCAKDESAIAKSASAGTWIS
jgi:hypothetical protein